MREFSRSISWNQNFNHPLKTSTTSPLLFQSFKAPALIEIYVSPSYIHPLNKTWKTDMLPVKAQISEITPLLESSVSINVFFKQSKGYKIQRKLSLLEPKPNSWYLCNWVCYLKWNWVNWQFIWDLTWTNQTQCRWRLSGRLEVGGWRLENLQDR